MKTLTNRTPGIVLILILMIIGVASIIVIVEQISINNVEKNLETKTMKENIEKDSLSTTSLQEKTSTSIEKTDKVDVHTPDIISTGIIYPKPTNLPLLRKYDINKDSNVEIWHAQKPESYIIPNNEWVKHFASQLYIDDNGRIMYKNMPIPRMQDIDGNTLSWTDKPFLNNYISDNELFNYPANADLWQNADYYLSHGMKGDCEDWAIAVVSMMTSGEMSIKENESYLRQVIPAKVVLGHSGSNLDNWIEYSIYGNTYISSTGTEFNPGIGKDQSITTFHQKRDGDGFTPIYQFTDKYFGRYNNKI